MPHMVSWIRRVWNGRDDADRIAVLGVNFVDAHRNQPWFRFPSDSQDLVDVKTVITSGSLIPLAVVTRVGRFRDDFFIDHVDDEYCLRARAMGYKVMITREPLSVHALGSRVVRQLPWRTIGSSNHSPARRYYMMRNHVILAKEYAIREPGWVIQTVCARSKSFVALLLVDDDRLLKSRLIWRGFVDGMSGRTGPLPPFDAAEP
jgi:rhamnosyltransferase